jgi:hypothetical protein
MNRRILLLGFAFAFLLLVAALSLCQPAQRAPTGAPGAARSRGPMHAVGMVTVVAIDQEQRSLEIAPVGARPSAGPLTILVAPDAHIYRLAAADLADLSPGDVVDARSYYAFADLIPEAPEVTFPHGTFAATAEVVTLQPLTLRAGARITITIHDTARLSVRRWQRIALSDIAVGDRISPVTEEADGGVTARWIQAWSPPAGRRGVLSSGMRAPRAGMRAPRGGIRRAPGGAPRAPAQ